MDGKWFLRFLSVFLNNYERYNIEIRYGGIPFEPFALPLVHGAISGTLVVYYLPNKSQIGREMGVKFFSLYLLNYESYRVEILYEAGPYISIGCVAISDALVTTYLPNLSQIGWIMVFKLFKLVSP